MPAGKYPPPTFGAVIFVAMLMLILVGVPIGLGIWALIGIIEAMR